MTSNYYECHNTCRPKRELAGNYWDVYVCDAACGGANIPSIYVYKINNIKGFYGL